MTFTSEKIETLMARGSGAGSSAIDDDSGDWITFVLREQGSGKGLRCIAQFERGDIPWRTFEDRHFTRSHNEIRLRFSQPEVPFTFSVQDKG
jgi:hypothetical protein